MSSRLPSTQVPRGPREFELFDDRMPIRRYKLLLQTFLKRRGTGSRQAFAEAIGATRGFVTQMTSPAYDLPIPAQHVRRIVELTGLNPDEERVFVDAYLEAHPDRAAEVQGGAKGSGGTRLLSIKVPALRSPVAQRRMESLIERLAKDVIATWLESEASGSADKADEPAP